MDKVGVYDNNNSIAGGTDCMYEKAATPIGAGTTTASSSPSGPTGSSQSMH